jgi:tRNA nucleotidyltransferase (CCA-adding enzyme)
MPPTPSDDIDAALRRFHPELDAVREASEAPVYLVGGAVRDLLLGRSRSDIDLVVVGEAADLAGRLGAEAIEHERFATAKVRLAGHEVDIASARAESYPHPGSLPEVEPATEIETDLARRDFTINAMAIPLRGEPRLIDPYDGRADLEAGLLRVLHPRSLVDDPTRALRAARYAARFGFEPEPRTAELIRAADLDSVSAERRQEELVRLAAETAAASGFELLEEWGLIETRAGGVALAARVAELLSSPPWQGTAPRERALLAAALGSVGEELRLASEHPRTPAQAVEMARGRDPVELVLARAMGVEWLDRYLLEWRDVSLEIDGGDLIAAGVPQGPAIGRGLAAALRGKLDGELSGREQELAAALAAARESPG